MAWHTDSSSVLIISMEFAYPQRRNALGNTNELTPLFMLKAVHLHFAICLPDFWCMFRTIYDYVLSGCFLSWKCVRT